MSVSSLVSFAAMLLAAFFNASDKAELVCRTPDCSAAAGIYNGIESLTVSLNAEGTVYYTVDGSYPTENSLEYTGQFLLKETTVVRAIAINGEARSDCYTGSFILNENHTLPVVSISSDAPERWKSIMNGTKKEVFTSGFIELFEDGKGFSVPCGLSLSGRSSTQICRKKSMRIDFGEGYGESRLKYDLFGEGETKYSSLILRAGTDSEKRTFNNEIWQDIALEMTDACLTQHSKFCIVYENGQYKGIYCIKDNVSRSFYASETGTDRHNVTSFNPGVDHNSSFYAEVYEFCRRNDMAISANYEYVCSKINIDSFIDFVILEAVSANTDLYYNVRAFSSPDTGGKWQFVFYDLDAALEDPTAAWNNVYGSYAGGTNNVLNLVLQRLMTNSDFRVKLIQRYAMVQRTYLSNEKVLAKIDYYQKLLEPEIERDRLRWKESSYNAWLNEINHMRHVITLNDWDDNCIHNFCKLMNMPYEEMN